TVDMHIRTLRKKLGDSAKRIETIIGVGYRLEGEDK
ncbi:MAG: helix-turn-helix domain-containing protein, partial [Bacteroidales bacterium]|nr:helix-turn-helix domain-containing protein [Bacteroidales bacterium]